MSTAKTILVIDDEAAILRLVRSHLEQAGYRVLTAGDGEEGLAMARQSRPDLLILDLNMPKKSGLEVYNDIVIDRDHKLFPVLILTGRGEFEDMFKELKADGFIAKPIDLPRLTAQVDRILRIDRTLGGPAPLEGTPRRILIYDNNDQLLEKVVLILVKSGHQVCIETTSEKLLEKASIGGIDVIVLDLLLVDRALIAAIKESTPKDIIVLYFIVRSDKITYTTVFELAEKMGISIQHVSAISNPAELVIEIEKRFIRA